MGPGTPTVLTSDKSTLPVAAVTSRKLKFPAPLIVVSCSQALPGPSEPTQDKMGVAPARVPEVLVPKTCHVSPAVVLSAKKLMLTELAKKLILAKLSWIKLPVVISSSPLGSFVRPTPFSSPPRLFPNRDGEPGPDRKSVV